MDKAFLSHSSFDKDFVSKVYEQLGAAKAVFDAETFKKNADIPLQIRDGLEGCGVYVLFLSKAAISSGWVSAELDVAHELKSKFQIRSVLIFQLDDTSWSELPGWTGRYIASCPPSPSHVALRILDEIRLHDLRQFKCVGRETIIESVSDQIYTSNNDLSYIYVSGPTGIGRKTLMAAVYKLLYSDVASHKIAISIDSFDDNLSIYRKLLGYSSNWRVAELLGEMLRFEQLSDSDQLVKLAAVLHDVSVPFRQVVVVDIGVSALDDEGKPLQWFRSLLTVLPAAAYPYVWFVSQRFMSDERGTNGVHVSLEPLSEKYSILLFRSLLADNKFSFPDRREAEYIERNIIGHPGLIVNVANYLRTNPSYKPNKTHGSVMKMIADQVQGLLQDYLVGDQEREKAVALFAEASILNYGEIRRISETWPGFERSVDSLLDSGFLQRDGGDYQLSVYLRRYAQELTEKYGKELAEARKILVLECAELGEDDYVPLHILDARIVTLVSSSNDFGGVIKNLIMPSQLLRAAKRKYDEEKYSDSLRLAREAYDQSAKLSATGILETWRLIGLSSIRLASAQDFDWFKSEYPRIPSGPKRETIFHFAHGFRNRSSGDLRAAEEWYSKIYNAGKPDYHTLRELSYIYALEGRYDEALERIHMALSLTPGNSYILDIKAFALQEKYKRHKSAIVLQALDDCISDLENADEVKGTRFYYLRSRIRDIVVNGDSSLLLEVYQQRESLPVHAKITLLSLLSSKAKNLQYSQLRAEVSKSIRDKKNRLAEIELAKVDIEHNAANGDVPMARQIYERYAKKFTKIGAELQLQLISHFEARFNRH
jgi:tetratricopeptide (TPR) repeat protein